MWREKKTTKGGKKERGNMSPTKGKGEEADREPRDLARDTRMKGQNDSGEKKRKRSPRGRKGKMGVTRVPGEERGGKGGRASADDPNNLSPVSVILDSRVRGIAEKRFGDGGGGMLGSTREEGKKKEKGKANPHGLGK